MKFTEKNKNSSLPATDYLVNNFTKSQERLHLNEKILYAINLAMQGLEKSQCYALKKNFPNHLRVEGYRQKLLYEKHLMWLRELFYLTMGEES